GAQRRHHRPVGHEELGAPPGDARGRHVDRLPADTAPLSLRYGPLRGTPGAVPGGAQNHCSNRSSAVQKPSPLLTCPCQISGMNPECGASRSSWVASTDQSTSPSPPCTPSPSTPTASTRCRCSAWGPRRSIASENDMPTKFAASLECDTSSVSRRS